MKVEFKTLIYLKLDWKEVPNLPRNTITYELLISCPGDVQSEILLIKECVSDFNDKFSNHLGVMVQVKHWGSSSFSQSGDKPQVLLNNQFVKDCDAAVSVFWTRFGTPTDEYGSGTEEEIEIMIEAGKQVFMYFSEKEVNPHILNIEQLDKIKAFKEKYKDKGIYFTYSTEKEFKDLFFSHLTMYFLSKKKIEEIEEKHLSNLIIRGISENNSIDKIAKVRKLLEKDAFNTKEDLEGIKLLYSLIDIIEVENYISTNLYSGLNFSKKVEVNLSSQNLIRSIAKELSIEISEKFFDLGGLSESTFGSLSILGQKDLIGGEKEKEKYELINELSKKISDLLSWVPIQEAFGSIDCLFLAIENNGKTFDEDIEVTLEFLKNEIITISEKPALKDSDAEYLINEFDLDDLLKIDQSIDYLSYDETVKTFPKMNADGLYRDPFGYNKRDYQLEYSKAFSDALKYEIFVKENTIILKIHFDYLKHNSVVAFPSPILLKEIPKLLKYKIKSKYFPDIVSGTINIISE